MALQLAKTLPFGVTANYWKIVRLTVDVLNGNGSVDIALYLDDATRQAGKDPIFLTGIAFGGAGVPFPIAALNTTNPIAAAYTALKASKDFQGAVDV